MLKWAYILIGDDNTGKTIFQKMLIEHLTGRSYEKLECNLLFDITARIGHRNFHTISFMNRSFQEKQSGHYISVKKFFDSYFKDADIAILSSQLYKQDISDMIQELRKRFFNVGVVFFENSITKNGAESSDISLLEWDDRFIAQNPLTDDEDSYINALKMGTLEFACRILNKK